jgi:hypothetical protein
MKTPKPRSGESGSADLALDAAAPPHAGIIG